LISTCTSTTFAQVNHDPILRLGARFGREGGAQTCALDDLGINRRRSLRGRLYPRSSRQMKTWIIPLI
jgi:hypothetical protein